jgi:hypothetical protein
MSGKFLAPVKSRMSGESGIGRILKVLTVIKCRVFIT